MCKKKIALGKAECSKAMKALETTVWQWQPDHLLAAHYFENSGNAYASAQEFEFARQMYIKAYESHIKAKCESSGADALKRAAMMAANQGKRTIAAQHYKEVADIWSGLGEIEKIGDYLMKAAQEMNNVPDKGDETIELQALASERLCAMDTPKDKIKESPILILEAYRFYFQLLVNRYLENNDTNIQKRLFGVANFMCNMYDVFGLESSCCKMMLSITILQLHLGDIILAEQTMLNEHFSNKDYLKSKEREVAEEMIQSFKLSDIDRLESAQRMVQLNYLDYPQIIKLAKNFSF